MRYFYVILLLLPVITLRAQIDENFDDGNFTANPIWTGSNNNADFVITDNKLRSNSNLGNASFFLSTGNKLATNTQWDFWVNLQFNTSGSNYTDIYVISDEADLKNTMINGYFIRIGNTDDEISLYKRSGTTATVSKIIDGVNGSVGSSNNTLKIRLKRDNTGKFTLEREVVSANSGYITEGTALDTEHTSTSYFGIVIQQSTATFFQKHFFDNIKVASVVTDTVPPSMSSVSVIDSNTIAITYSEAMDSISTKGVSNYAINNNGGPILKVLTTNDPAKFHIKLANNLNSDTYSISVANIRDINGNLISNNQRGTFTYIKPYTAKFGDVVINELLADPAPQIDLPSVEFVELRNNTIHSISLKGWKFSDSGSSATLGDITIASSSFLIICAKADTAEFKPYGKVLGLSPWPSLNNSGELIKLFSSKGTPIDSVNYSDSWYRNTTKKQGGWTLERKHPGVLCSGAQNWFASTDSTGGTPGKKNSVFVADYENLKLTADSLKQISDTSITIYFNKPLNNSTLIAENFILNPTASSIKKIIANFESNEIRIIYDQKFVPDTRYQLNIKNLEDCYGVPLLGGAQNLTFNTKKIVSVSNPPDTSRIVITEIFADPSPEVHLPLAEYIEVYNPSSDTIDLNNWSVSDPTTKAIIRSQKILPREYLILCPAADTIHYKLFGKTIGLNPWPSLNNISDQVVLKSFKNRVVDSVAYYDTWYRSNVKKLGGWSLEKIDLTSVCEPPFNWNAAIDTNGGTPGRANSVAVTGYDLVPVKADSIKLVTDSSLKVYFNKHLNSSTLTAGQFILSPANSIKKISSDLMQREVTLVYEQKFVAGTNYKLLVSLIKDCSGKSITDSQLLQFKTNPPSSMPPERIDTAKIIITEIFADPSPEVGLPLAEFIELYNPGAHATDLNKWILNDSGTKAVFTAAKIEPGEYLILCSTADTLLFRPFGKTKGISPWPSLGNGGDQITLKSFTQRVVDSIVYSDKWYKNQKKKNGGWSLEKEDLLINSCNGFYNWFSSIDTTGGTPGRANSRKNPGISWQQIKIDSVGSRSDSTVIVHLNSIPDTIFFKSSHFSIDNKIGAALEATFGESFLTIHLKFGAKFNEGTKYLLTVDSLFNCSGIKSNQPNNQALFTKPIIPEENYPVYINEILADPSPQVHLPEVEFVELYNPTEQTVSLKGMYYGDASVLHKFTSGEIAPLSYLILCPEKDTSSFTSFGNVKGLPVWPLLANEKDVLVLKNNKGREFQRIAYNSDWYRNGAKKSGGYSLEMISPASICAGSQNWAASIDSAGGTPGKRNSIFNDSPGDALKLVDVILTDSITLLLTFNKTVDSLSASSAVKYHINNGMGEPESAITLSPDFDKVQLKLRNAPTRGNTYKIELKEIRDCSGTPISTGFNQGEFILTERVVKNAVLISEVLFNPRPNGVDFIEIYNNSNHTLDLKDLSIASMVKDSIGPLRPISIKQKLFKPGHYLAVTTDPEIIKKEYRIESPDQILKAALPAFNDDKGVVGLLSNGVQIDQLNYSEKMHFQLLKTFDGISLERSSFKLKTNEPGNFRSATDASGFATPGYKNSQYNEESVGFEEFALVSKTFSPDNDGFEDLLQVSYRLPAPGMVANVKIFNDQGMIIKHLLKNSTLNSEGMFVWDGLNEFNTAAASGIYFIVSEVFDTSGNVRRFRKAFALAANL
ncbi:MAG: lamin tail domain-containing protein [Daejeonella sp.]|uniref:lamin tail domain-containing protein n=1 Tax=Daejeonella sp. TaxID=2805397 RepID=UPI003C72A06B